MSDPSTGPRMSRLKSGRLRVGVLGCGQVSAHHFVAWMKCRGVEVVACCDPVRERAQVRANAFAVPAIYDDAERMFATERLDLVDIISPRAKHAGNLLMAARFHVDALCEKPLCPTLAEAEELVEKLGESIRVMVNENWRYRPYFTKIGEWIRAGRLGRLVRYRVALIRSGLLPDASGRVDAIARMPFVAREGRYLIAESLIHELDVARSLIGELSLVASRIGRVSDDVVGEDTSVMLLETPAGVPVIVEGTLSAAGHQQRGADRLEIIGTRCSVLLEDARLRLFGAENEEHLFNEEGVRQECFDIAIRHFVDCMRRGDAFWTSAADQLGTLKLVEDAYAMAGPLRRLP